MDTELLPSANSVGTEAERAWEAMAGPRFRWLVTDWKAEPLRGKGASALGCRYSFDLHACEMAGEGFGAHRLRHRIITKAGASPWAEHHIDEQHGPGETVCRRFDIGLYGTGDACWTGIAEVELTTESNTGVLTRHRFRVRLPFGGRRDAWEGHINNTEPPALARPS